MSLRAIIVSWNKRFIQMRCFRPYYTIYISGNGRVYRLNCRRKLFSSHDDDGWFRDYVFFLVLSAIKFSMKGKCFKTEKKGSWSIYIKRAPGVAKRKFKWTPLSFFLKFYQLLANCSGSSSSSSSSSFCFFEPKMWGPLPQKSYCHVVMYNVWNRVVDQSTTNSVVCYTAV